MDAIKALLEGVKEYNFVAGFNESIDLFRFLEAGNALDILLLDIQLNEEDGIKICEKLQAHYSEIIVIMLSSNTQGAIVMDALKKGARGFLPKNTDLPTFIEAFEETLHGKTYIHKEVSLLSTGPKSSKFDYVPKLTRRETEVLRLILDEMTTSEIATSLHLSPSTVETHRASLFSKTGAKNVVGLIKFTIEKGLLN